jgi:hypothetical protein
MRGMVNAPAPTKTCPNCGFVAPAADMNCPQCGSQLTSPKSGMIWPALFGAFAVASFGAYRMSAYAYLTGQGFADRALPEFLIPSVVAFVLAFFAARWAVKELQKPPRSQDALNLVWILGGVWLLCCGVMYLTIVRGPSA